MQVSVFLMLLSTVSSLSEGIDLSLCSADRLYCFDPITQSIVKVGAHSLSSPFGVSNSQTFTAEEEIAPEKMQGAVHAANLIRGRGQESIQEMYRIRRPGRGLRLAPECGVDHDPITCRMVSPGSVRETRNVQLVGLARKEIVQPEPPIAREVLSANPIESISDPCTDPPIVTRTEDSICYTKPKKKYMTVQCCKTSKIPVKQNSEPVTFQGAIEHIPCVCPDGRIAEPVVYSSGIVQGTKEIPVNIDSLVQKRILQRGKLSGPTQTYLNELLAKENKIRKNIIELTLSEQDNLVGEQDKIALMKAIPTYS